MMMEGNGIMDINKRNLTFSVNNDEELERVVKENSILREIPANKIFMYQDEKLEYLYFIKEGKTRHYMVDPNGAEKILYILTKGWFFGEISFTLGYDTTSLYSETEVDTSLYLIKRKRAKELLDNDKVFREGILRSHAFKAMILRHEIENILFNSSKDRIKRFLSVNVNQGNISDSDWIEIGSKYTHYEIGILIGCTRVTVSKMMGELANEGFIRVINNKIQINKKLYYNYINAN